MALRLPNLSPAIARAVDGEGIPCAGIERTIVSILLTEPLILPPPPCKAVAVLFYAGGPSYIDNVKFAGSRIADSRKTGKRSAGKTDL